MEWESRTFCLLKFETCKANELNHLFALIDYRWENMPNYLLITLHRFSLLFTLTLKHTHPHSHTYTHKHALTFKHTQTDSHSNHTHTHCHSIQSLFLSFHSVSALRCHTNDFRLDFPITLSQMTERLICSSFFMLVYYNEFMTVMNIFSVMNMYGRNHTSDTTSLLYINYTEQSY